jgi:inner membrane protein
MDPLTHGLLGASLGQALSGQALGRRAPAWGAVLAMAPDVDMLLLRSSDPFAEWRWHRGATHGLAVELAAGCLIGYLLARRSGGALRSWILLALAALASHPLLDWCTTYGTQLLAPFSNRRFALDWVAIIDPAYSLILAAGLVIARRAGAATPAARRAACAVLSLSSLYLALGGYVNARIEAIARDDLREKGLAFSRVSAYPTLLQLPFRRIVARSGDDVRVGWLSLLQPRPIAWQSFTQAEGPAVEAARATPEGRLFEWFAMGEAASRVERRDGRLVVELDDMRYGFPGSPRDGFWGVRVTLDADGRPLGRGERFERPLPAPVSKILYTLWRETLGWS